ncbi:MAG: NAD(P)-dependent oxidoreductase, partial [Acidimicrobiales bacterium]
ASMADVIVLSLPLVDALARVAGELAAAGRPNAVAVETGTFPLADKTAARDVLAGSDIELLDAPLSGTGLQAADGTLVVLSSGPEPAHRHALPVFDAIGKQTFHLGRFGNGSRMKYVANLLVAVHTLAAAEAHRLGAASGLDPEVVQQVIGPGAGGSTMFDVRGPMMVAGEYLPPSARLAIILKDAGIISAHARDVDAPTPLLDAAIPLYAAGVETGLGDSDAAALRQLLETWPLD